MDIRINTTQSQYPVQRITLLALVFIVTICVLTKYVARYVAQQRMFERWEAAGALALFDKNGDLTELLADLSPGRFRPSSLADLKDCQTLTILRLNCVDVTDADLDVLAYLPNLRSLSLDRGITDGAIGRISKLSRLRTLILQDANITDECVSELLKLRQLDELVVVRTRITDAGILRLREGLPLTNIDDTYGITILPPCQATPPKRCQRPETMTR